MNKNSFTLICIISTLFGCAKGTEPRDPFEPYNREVYKFNKAFDATVLKPPAKLYKAVVPDRVRLSVTNAYDNVRMLPTIANDLLQGEVLQAYKDSWRFFLNSTIGIAGLFDPAETMGLPPRSNDLGITLAKWGDTDSPYFMLPFFGPSTLRDTAGWFLDYSAFTVYPHIDPASTRFGLIAGRYLDLRTALLDKEELIEEAFDEYSFIRDAYLQHRQYKINGDSEDNSESLYIDGEEEETLLPSTELAPKVLSALPFNPSKMTS